MGEETVSRNFIEQEIDKDLVSAGAERISSYRTCQVYPAEFWSGEEV